MGVEVKGAGDGVVIADRGCNDCYNRNSGWGSGWGAVGGALVGGGFGAAAVSVWDKINDTKAEAIVSECDNILNSINQSPSAPSKPAPGFEEFRQYMDQRISTQETLLQRIAQELGLDKPKQQ